MAETLTVLILTYNEEQHIARCLHSVQGLADRICIVDSQSTDQTCQIARVHGAEVIQHPFTTHAAQLKFGLQAFDIDTDWVLRLDADEYLEARLHTSLRAWLAEPDPQVSGLTLRRKIVFLGRPIRHGFFYPARILRLWRTGQGQVEQRWMDEHVRLDRGRVARVEAGDLVDHNLNDLSWWIAKHDRYAQREVYDMVATATSAEGGALAGPSARKRWIKTHLYARVPTALRSTIYFLYRYVLGLGVLDGKAGFYFHFLQAYWYRTLVDAKQMELDQRAALAQVTPYELLRNEGVLP